MFKDDRSRKDVAHLDAEGIEHHLYPQMTNSLEKLIPVLKKIKPIIINEFGYCVFIDKLVLRFAMGMEGLYLFLSMKYLQFLY